MWHLTSTTDLHDPLHHPTSPIGRPLKTETIPQAIPTTNTIRETDEKSEQVGEPDDALTKANDVVEMKEGPVSLRRSLHTIRPNVE